MRPQDIYSSVTQTIIELLESHQLTWERPWIALGQDNDFARNPTTQNYYRGINQFVLSTQLLKKSYLKNMWMTFAQAKNLKGQVKKGEKSTPIIFYKTMYKDRENKSVSPDFVQSLTPVQCQSLGITSIPVLKQYRVFNIAQTSGLNPAWYEIEPQEPLQEFEKDEHAENLVKATGANIEIEASNQAYYNRVTDTIHLPLREQFKSQTEPFYATILHELGHWTGHNTRLNRTFGKSFGDTEYGQEELVAELTSAFCCAHLGFSKTISN